METKARSRYIVIMAGGGGTRLWPHSRRNKPKQFLPLLPGGESLLGATVRRTQRIVPLSHTWVITTAEQVPEVRRCLPDLPLDNILVEPVGRNTAPCIALAARTLFDRDPDAVLAVLPADHYVQDPAAFVDCLSRALDLAQAGDHIVTLGIRPTHPETGYGYIQLGVPDASGAHCVDAFVEKPDRSRATAYVSSGRYLWNSGVFFFRAARILAEVHQQLPDLTLLLDEIMAHPGRLGSLYPSAPSISIDYAVMEKLGAQRIGPQRAIRVLTGDFGWNDVGSFAALDAVSAADAAGNYSIAASPDSPPPILVQSERNIVYHSGPQLVTALGVEDLVIAVTPDAVLVLPRSRAQEVREIVSQLGKLGHDGLL